MPITVRPGWSPSRALVWPARPSGAATSTALSVPSAGASRSLTRSSMTGTCVAAVVFTPTLPRPTSGVPHLRCPARSPSAAADWPVPAGVGEVASAGPPRRGWRPRRALDSVMRVRSGPALQPPRRRSRSQNPWQHLLRCVRECVFLLLQVGLPGGRVPDLQPCVRADHDAVAAQRRVLAQRGRDRHPALLVGNLV